MRTIFSHLLVYLLIVNNYAYANIGNSNAETWVKTPSSESMLLDVYSKDTEKGKDFKIEASIKNLSAGNQVVTELENQLKDIKDKNPNAKVYMKFQVEDSGTKENFDFKPNHFFEFEPKEQNFWDKVDSFLISKKTSLNSVGLASIRFTANFVAGATVFVLGAGHSLQAAALASGALSFLSAGLTTFPKVYSDYLLTPRFSHNKIFGKNILGIMTLEIFLYYQVLEFVFSSLGPSLLAMLGYVSHVSFVSFLSSAIIPIFFVALSQGALEKVYDLERKKKTLQKITAFTKNFDYGQLMAGYRKDLNVFNTKMVVISLLTIIGMGLAMVGKLYSLPTLTYISSITIALMFGLAVWKKWTTVEGVQQVKLEKDFKRRIKIANWHLSKLYSLPKKDIAAILDNLKKPKSTKEKASFASRQALGHLKSAVLYGNSAVFGYSLKKLKMEKGVTENAGSILGNIITSIGKNGFTMKPIKCSQVGSGQ